MRPALKILWLVLKILLLIFLAQRGPDFFYVQF